MAVQIKHELEEKPQEEDEQQAKEQAASATAGTVVAAVAGEEDKWECNPPEKKGKIPTVVELDMMKIYLDKRREFHRFSACSFAVQSRLRTGRAVQSCCLLLFFKADGRMIQLPRTRLAWFITIIWFVRTDLRQRNSSLRG